MSNGGNGGVESNNVNFDDDRPVEETAPTSATGGNMILGQLVVDGDKNAIYLQQITSAVRVMESKHQIVDPRYTQLRSLQTRLLRKFFILDRLKNPVNANISSEHNRQLASQATFFSYLKSTPSVPAQLMQAALLRQPLGSDADEKVEPTDLIQSQLQNYIVQQEMHWPIKPEFIYPKADGIAVPPNFAASSNIELIRQQAAVEVESSIKTRVDAIAECLSQPQAVQQHNSTEYLRLKAELKALNLKELQRRVRKDFNAANRPENLSSSSSAAEFEHQRSIPAKPLHVRDERRRITLNLISERREKLHRQRFLAAVVQHHREFKDAHKQNQQRASKIVRAVGLRLMVKEREREKEQERLERERMKRIMVENEAEYRELVARKRDQRLAEFLQQTDQFIAQLTDLVMQHKQSQSTAPAVSSFANDVACRNSADPLSSGDARLREVLIATRREDEAFFSSMEANSSMQQHATSSNSHVNDEQPAVSSSAVVDEAYYAVAHSITETITEQPSIIRGGRLKDYQLRGLEWLVSLYNNHLNGILADEMGLGKTIQTIALIAYLVEKKHKTGPYIIIVPLSTMCNWLREFSYWAPSLVTIAYSGTKADRAAMMPQIRAKRFNVLITTYDYVMRDTHKLKKIDWQYMIIDEGHRMKNAQCKLTLTLNKYYDVKHRLLLTGTPLQNRLPELWALLNFVLPTIFKSCDTFEQWFNAPFALPSEKDKVELREEETMLIVRRLHKVLRPFLLRRLKKEVAAELPDKLEYVVKCPMSALQRVLYEHMEKYKTFFNSKTASTKAEDADSEDFVALTTSGTSSAVNYAGSNSYKKGVVLANTIMQLRKICNHPFLFDGCEKTIGQHLGYADGYVNGADLYRVCGKFEMLDRLLPKLQKSGHRCLIFCQMTSLMSILEDFLRWRNITYLRLDGSTKADERDALMEKFRAPESPYFVFLLSTRAGGVGLNLQAADTVIIFDQDWNPTQDQQAQDRVHRIGQKRKVLVLRLLTVNSIEERIEAAAQRKRDMDQVVIQAGLFDAKSTVSERQQLLQSILGSRNLPAKNAAPVEKRLVSGSSAGLAADAVGENENEILAAEDAEDTIPDDEMINEIISRSTEEFDLFQRMDVERVEKQDAAELNGKSRLMQENELPAFMQANAENLNLSMLENAPKNENVADASVTTSKPVFNSPLAIRSILAPEWKKSLPETKGFNDIFPPTSVASVLPEKIDILSSLGSFSNGTCGDGRESISPFLNERPVHAIGGEMSLSPTKKTVSIVTPHIDPDIAANFSATLSTPLYTAANVDSNHRASRRKRKVLYDNLGDNTLFEDKQNVPKKRGRPMKNPRLDDGAVADNDVESNNFHNTVRMNARSDVDVDFAVVPKSKKVRGSGKRGRPRKYPLVVKTEADAALGRSRRDALLLSATSKSLLDLFPPSSAALSLQQTFNDVDHHNNGNASLVSSQRVQQHGVAAEKDKEEDSDDVSVEEDKVEQTRQGPSDESEFWKASSSTSQQKRTVSRPLLTKSNVWSAGTANHLRAAADSSHAVTVRKSTDQQELLSSLPTMRLSVSSNHQSSKASSMFKIAKKPKDSPSILMMKKAPLLPDPIHHSPSAMLPNGNSSSSSVSLIFPRNRPLPTDEAATKPKYGSFGQVLNPKPIENRRFSSINHFNSTSNNNIPSTSIFARQQQKRPLVVTTASPDDEDDEAEEGEIDDGSDDDDAEDDEYYDNVSDDGGGGGNDDDDNDDDDNDNDDVDEHDDVSDDDDEVADYAEKPTPTINGAAKVKPALIQKNTVATLKIRTGGGGSSGSIVTAASSSSSSSSAASSSNSQLSTSTATTTNRPGVIVTEEANGPLGKLKLRIKF